MSTGKKTLSPSSKVTWTQRVPRKKGDAWRGWIKYEGKMYWGPTVEDPYEAHEWSLKMRQHVDKRGEMPWGERVHVRSIRAERGGPPKPGDMEWDLDPETGEQVMACYDPPRPVPDVDPKTGARIMVFWTESSNEGKSVEDRWLRFRAKNKHKFADLSDPTLLIAAGAKYEELTQTRTEGMQRWFRNHARLIVKHFSPDRKLRDITRQDLEDFRDHRLEKVSASTVCHDLRCLSGVYSRAHSGGFEFDPLKHVKKPRIDTPQVPWFEHNEVLDILDKIADSGEKNAKHDSAVIAVFYLLGFRHKEASDVLLEHIDLKRGFVHIAKSKRKPRTLRLPPAAIPFLDTLIGDRKSGHLFEVGYSGISKVFSEWKERLGEPRLLAKAMRTSCGTTLYGKPGSSSADVAAWMGHDISMCSTYHRLTSRHVLALAQSHTLIRD